MVALPPSSASQARELFLAEALELCQQIKEELLIFALDPAPPLLQKLVRRIEMLRGGAEQTELTDIRLWAESLTALLAADAEPADVPALQELLNRFCDGLQLALMAHRSSEDSALEGSQREFVLYSLMPKVLEDFELICSQTLSAALQTLLIRQQLQWIQYWSKLLELTELQTIAEAALKTDAAFPQYTLAIAPVALAGLQVASEAIVQRLMAAMAASAASAVGASAVGSAVDAAAGPRSPSKQALSTFKKAQHLVALAYQTIFCIRQDSIADTAILGQLQQTEQGQVIWRSQTLPLYSLNVLWEPAQSNPPALNPTAMLLILSDAVQHIAVALDVDRLIVPELQLRQEKAAQRLDCCYGVTDYCGAAVRVVDLNWLLWERVGLSLTVRTPPEVSERSGLQSNAAQSALSADGVSDSDPTTEAKTILIVDDSKTVREMLALTLQEAGYSVLQVEDGQQAIEWLRQAEIHLTICDLEMSNLSGFEFLRHRLQDQRWAQIPVIILSSHAGEEYRQLARKLGAVDYFTIPYSPVELVQTIAALIQPQTSLGLG